MRITDIIIESKKIDEAPVGMLKRAGLGIASKLGSTKASGALDTAATANGLKKAYDRYLGQTGQKPSSETILAFLQSNGLPTDAANKAIQQAGAAAGIQVAPAKDMKKTLGIGNKTNGPMATPNPKEPTGQQPGSEVDYDTPTYQRKGMADPETEPLDPNKLKQSALKAKLKGGRGIGKKTGGGFNSAVKAGQAKGLNMSMTNETSVTEVALKGSTIDKIILAAVQDSIKQGMGQQLSAVAAGQSSTAAAPSGQDDSGSSAGTGFMAGVKRGLKGAASQQVKGRLNTDQLTKLLPNVDPVKLKRAVQLSLGGQDLPRELQGVMSQAFSELIKLDPQTTTKAMTLLKAVQTN